MALAMITTFYGALLANFFALPISRKLQIYNNEEMLLKEVQIEGMLSIQNGENPRIIEEKLKAFLSPTLRKTETSAGE
jgi:chemotaxis protein MotA